MFRERISLVEATDVTKHPSMEINSASPLASLAPSCAQKFPLGGGFTVSIRGTSDVSRRPW